MDFVQGRRDLHYISESFDRRKVKAVALDLDGTVVDSVDRIVNCITKAFDLMSLDKPDVNDIKSIIGKKLEEGITYLLPDDKKHMGSEVTKVYREAFIDNEQFNKQILFDGVGETLDYLASKNYIIAIASGRYQVGVKRALDTTVLGKYVTAFCAGDEVPSKPHPQMALTLASRLGIEPENMLGVGDTDMDIELFKNAGAMSAAVQTGVWSGDAIKTINPDIIVPAFVDLKDIL